MATPLSRQDAQDAKDALAAHGGNATKAAISLHLARSTFQARIERANSYGMYDAIPEPIPEGQSITGVSTLYDAAGQVRAQWVKTKTDKNFEDLSQAIKDMFHDYKGCSVLPAAPKHADKDLVTVYNISDHHLGLYSWEDETGADYDLQTGVDLLKASMRQLVASSPASHTAVILNLGDFFHSDTSRNQTSNSGNPLDVDTRYAKVIRAGLELLKDCVELALQKHKKVILRCLPGNHDEHSALALTVAFSMFFKNNRRVDVDPSPSRFFAQRFGKVLVAATHGDMVKMRDMPGVMASYWPEDWGLSKWRYGYTGHVHHNSKLEVAGAQCESFQTLAAKDAWHAASGYSSGRSMVAITHHIEKGEYCRNTVSV